MADFKAKGHNLEVSKVVVHKIKKAGGQKLTGLKLADQELNVGTQEIHFVADIRNSFQKKSRPTYGIFDPGSTLNRFHEHLQKYLDKEIGFLDLTQKSMEFYKYTIEKSAPATGAFVVFADFLLHDNNDRYILVLSINNNQGYNLNEDELTIQQILNLDLSKLDVAALINVTKWQKHINDPNGNIKTYLSFIKGKKQLSDYFLDFIGCADKSTSAESSKRLISAMNRYFEEQGYTLEDCKVKKKVVFDYCETCINEKTEVLLDQISYLLNEEDPKAFAIYASSEENGVGAVIKPDRTVLKSMQFVEFKSKDLTIVFNKSKLNDKEIVYNRAAKSLTIKTLPEALIEQLEQNNG